MSPTELQKKRAFRDAWLIWPSQTIKITNHTELNLGGRARPRMRTSEEYQRIRRRVSYLSLCSVGAHFIFDFVLALHHAALQPLLNVGNKRHAYTPVATLICHHSTLHCPPVCVRASSLARKVGIPNFVSGPGEYIMEGEYVILKITGLLYLYWSIRLGCYAMGLPMSDSVWNCGRSIVLWVPGTSGSICNGILGEYFPEREYKLLDPKKTRKRPKFQPCLRVHSHCGICHLPKLAKLTWANVTWWPS